jgi:hypothetical protein
MDNSRSYAEDNGLYDLNFLAFGTLSPLRMRSAPTFLPLLGHPYLGLHEPPNKINVAQAVTAINFFTCFICGRFKG